MWTTTVLARCLPQIYDARRSQPENDEDFGNALSRTGSLVRQSAAEHCFLDIYIYR